MPEQDFVCSWQNFVVLKCQLKDIIGGNETSLVMLSPSPFLTGLRPKPEEGTVRSRINNLRKGLNYRRYKFDQIKEEREEGIDQEEG